MAAARRRHHRRRRALHAAKASIQDGHEGTDDDAMKKLLEALARIEGRLGTLVDVTIHKPELPLGGPTPMESAAAAAAQPAAAEPASEGPAPAPSAAVKPLAEYSVPELLREVEALETGRRRLRDELIERYERADEQLAKLRGEQRPAEERDGEGDRPRRNGRRPDDGAASRSERDPQGGKVGITKLGDRGRFVRRSKIALVALPRREGQPEHAKLRRALRREAAHPGRPGSRRPHWRQAVKAAQHLAGRPVTGELDGELTQILRRTGRATTRQARAAQHAGAWRTIPGQLTPNFNVKEFACKDAAHTPYVKGLMREKGLSKKPAARAREGAGHAARARPPARRRPAARGHLGVPHEGLQRLAARRGDELRPHARLRRATRRRRRASRSPAQAARAAGVRVRRRLLPGGARLLRPRRLRPPRWAAAPGRRGMNARARDRGLLTNVPDPGWRSSGPGGAGAGS